MTRPLDEGQLAKLTERWEKKLRELGEYRPDASLFDYAGGSYTFCPLVEHADQIFDSDRVPWASSDYRLWDLAADTVHAAPDSVLCPGDRDVLISYVQTASRERAAREQGVSSGKVRNAINRANRWAERHGYQEIPQGLDVFVRRKHPAPQETVFYEIR